MNNWKYKLKIYDKDNKEILIESPVRLEATITFGINGQSGSGTFTLYNLSASHRAEIRYNPSILAMNIKTFIDVSAKVEFYVSQDGQSFTKIFEGALVEAYSQETGGAVGIATYITANMIYTQLALSSHIFAKGTSKREAIKTIVKDIPNVKLGNLGSIEGNFLTDTTCDGNAFEQIQKITGGNAFVDNGELNVIPPNESVDAFLDKIHDDTALLGTPMVKEAYISFKCMFIPELRYLQYLDIDSHIYSDFSGSYKVVGYTHTLVFSETEGGSKTTDVCCLACDESPNQDIVSTMGTSKNDENYETLTTTQTKNKVKGEDVSTLNSQEKGDIVSVLRYIRTHNGEVPNSKITKNISWKEMLASSSSTTNADRKQDLNEQILGRCVTIAKKLQQFKDTYLPSGTTITFNSGWRSRRANATIPGASSNSWHVKGGAVDIKFGSNTRSYYKQFFWKNWDGGHGYGSQGYIHVDIGSRRAVYRYPN